MNLYQNVVFRCFLYTVWKSIYTWVHDRAGLKSLKRKNVVSLILDVHICLAGSDPSIWGKKKIVSNDSTPETRIGFCSDAFSAYNIYQPRLEPRYGYAAIRYNLERKKIGLNPNLKVRLGWSNYFFPFFLL